MQSTRFATHEVGNQPPPLIDYNVFTSDLALVEAVTRENGGRSTAALGRLGERAGEAESREWARLANDYPPVFRSHDTYGNRIDFVEYHPAYHELMRSAVGHGLHAAPWASDAPGAHVDRAAGFEVWYQVEAGHMCPISMTYSVLPALSEAPGLADEWRPLVTSRSYDARDVHVSRKDGAIFGMAMTEKQGGSDVRSNTTTAERRGDGSYELVGHKWFCSAPMSDGFLVLAQAPEGLTCFLVPRWIDVDARNEIRIQRLKDKLGNRANASSEIELTGAVAHRVGDEGRGVATIIEMVNHTRLDCILGSTALMRAGVTNAVHHARHRRAFGRELIDQPLMTNVLADLAIESEAATQTAMRIAGAYDRSEDAFARLATAVTKYWVCKRAPAHVAEALECLGGLGYVEDSGMPRIFRESPVNGVWEGSGNVICLDVLRAMARSPESVAGFWAEVRAAEGADGRLDAFCDTLDSDLAALPDTDPQGVARRFVERMALALQGSLLVRYSPPAVADAFCASRLDADWGLAFGTLPAAADPRAIVARALPEIA